MLVVLLWRSHAADWLRESLDPPPPHLTALHGDMLAFHLRGDAALPAGGWRLFGDSLMQGMPTSALALPAANYGIGNDDIVGLAARLPHYASIAWAEGVIIAVGINDLEYESVDRIVAHYAALLDELPREIIVLCHGVLPIDERIVGADPEGRSNARIAALNSGLQALCDNSSRRYVPPPAELAGTSGNLRAGFHVGDGVHLDTDGYAVWIEYLNNVLMSAVGQSEHGLDRP